MRTAALVLGIVGGVFGIIMAILYIFWEIGSSFGFNYMEAIILGVIAIAAAIAGIIGGALANRSPVASGILLLAGGLVGFVTGLFWLFVPAPTLIVGGILELVSISQEKGLSLNSGVRRPGAVPGPQPMGTFQFNDKPGPAQPVNPVKNPAAPGQPAAPGSIPIVNIVSQPSAAAVAPAVAATGECPSCGSQNQPGQKFCTGCGTQLA